jgi:hypothetical protein
MFHERSKRSATRPEAVTAIWSFIVIVILMFIANLRVTPARPERVASNVPSNE